MGCIMNRRCWPGLGGGREGRVPRPSLPNIQNAHGNAQERGRGDSQSGNSLGGWCDTCSAINVTSSLDAHGTGLSVGVS